MVDVALDRESCTDTFRNQAHDFQLTIESVLAHSYSIAGNYGLGSLN